MSQLEWVYSGGEWVALALSPRDHYRCCVDSNGQFLAYCYCEDVNEQKEIGVYDRLHEAQEYCQRTEDTYAALEAAKPAVKITGPCMGRMRNGTVVEIVKNDDAENPWKTPDDMRIFHDDGTSFSDPSRDIVETWPLPEQPAGAELPVIKAFVLQGTTLHLFGSDEDADEFFRSQACVYGDIYTVVYHPAKEDAK